MGPQQLFGYVPTCLDIYIREPRHVANPSDWPANLLRFQFPESLSAYDGDGGRLWEFNFETSDHPWRVVEKADEKTVGGARRNRVMRCEDLFERKALIRRTATWSDRQLDFELSIQNLGDKRLDSLQTSMCLQRTAAPDYYDRGNDRTFLVSGNGFAAASELVFHPQKHMFYGEVGQRISFVDQTSPSDLKEAALFVISADRRYVLCYAWRDATRVFMNRSGRTRCLHSELKLTGIAPGQHVAARGVLFVSEGTLGKAYDRFLTWKQNPE